jgi:hypothetical protein
MGAGASSFLFPLNNWIKTQRIANPVPPPSIEDVKRNYIAVVKYAYSKPADSVIYLGDIQARFFNKTCEFRWTWSEDRPDSPLNGLMSIVETPSSSGEAVESYRIVVEAIAKDPVTYKDILDDIKLRYFSTSAKCDPRKISKPEDYGLNFDPVFR